ncbi:MAG: hypothetical protein JSS00_10725 [Proteobacteria bacterium]|nr:hypothetical protein [Pseudomonadota bacterium]
MTENRKLATILSLDVAGYSHAAELNDRAAAEGVRKVRALITEVASPLGGRIFSSAGDGFMLEFPSATAGVRAALALLNESASERRALPKIRIGLHLGEVMVEDNGDLLGHGVNVAARLQVLAEPGSAIASEAVKAQVRTDEELPFTPAGRVQLDKMSEKIAVFRLGPGHAKLLNKISRRRLARALLFGGLAAVPVLGFTAWRLLDRRPGTNAPPTLAVLPFSALGGGADDAAFAAGLHDDLLTRLGSITALRVIARNSVLAYAGATTRASQIAHELGANAVVEGAVQRSGNRVRVTVQLIDGGTEVQKWSDTYDRTLTADNLFDIQREMTEAIAHALGTVLTAQEMTEAFVGGTHNLDAYEAYARGRLLVRDADPAQDDAYAAAIAAFDQALARDPNFASAYAMKAYALSRSFVSFEPQQTADRQLRDEARLALERAHSLAPNAAATHFAFAAYFYWGYLDYGQSLHHMDQALAAAPNDADFWDLKALITRRAGRFAESIAAFDRAISLDPLNMDAIVADAFLLGITGGFAQSEALLARARAIGGSPLTVNRLSGLVRSFQGDAAGAWTLLKNDRSAASQDLRLSFAMCTRNAANVEFALRDWPEEFRRPPSFPQLYDVDRAIALRMLGRTEEARRLLLQVKAQLDASANPYPDGAPMLPDVVPGLLGDLAGVRAAERDFAAHAPNDELYRLARNYSFAVSFLNAGDADRAIHYLQANAAVLGPSFFLRLTIDPQLDALREHPGYLALKRNFEIWRGSPH